MNHGTEAPSPGSPAEDDPRDRDERHDLPDLHDQHGQQLRGDQPGPPQRRPAEALQHPV